jgi:hypothetical protein
VGGVMKILVYDDKNIYMDLVKKVLTKNLNFSVELTKTNIDSDIIPDIQSIKPEIFISDIKIGKQSICCMNLMKIVKGYSPKTLIVLLGENCIFPCVNCEYSDNDRIKYYDFFIDTENGIDELSEIASCYPLLNTSKAQSPSPLRIIQEDLDFY